MSLWVLRALRIAIFNLSLTAAFHFSGGILRDSRIRTRAVSDGLAILSNRNSNVSRSENRNFEKGVAAYCGRKDAGFPRAWARSERLVGWSCCVLPER